jgi:hypothetical protein
MVVDPLFGILGTFYTCLMQNSFRDTVVPAIFETEKRGLVHGRHESKDCTKASFCKNGSIRRLPSIQPFFEENER